LVLVVYRVHAALNGRAGFITLITTGGAGIVCAVATVIVLWLAKKPDLAVVGVVAADVSTTWLMLAAAAISVRRLPELRFSTRLRKLLTVVHRPTMRVVVSLGWPVGAVVLLDSLASLVGQFLVGRFWLEALPVHAIVAMCTSVGIVIPVGISLACVQHVAVLEAQRDWVGRNRVAAASIGLALLYGLVVMAAFCTMPQSLGAAVLGSAFDAPRRALYDQLMVPGGIVLAFQSEIIIVAALYRGIGDTRTPLLVALVGYLIVAGGAQVLLAFGLGHGAPGIWWGLVIGFGAIACVATLGIYQRLKLPPEMRQTSARASHGEAALTHGLLAREDAQVTGPVTR
jgi:MATE family multidrug resistance protein